MRAKQVNAKRLLQLIKFTPHIPDGTAGDIKVTHYIHPAGKPIQVVSMRNTLLMGYHQMHLSLDKPLDVSQLSYNGGVWMTSEPQELWQMDLAIKEAYGNVLIGGLGLGIISHMMSRKRKVKWTTTVEKDGDIASLVWPYISEQRRTLVIDDLFNYLRDLQPGVFDYAFFDIWQGTGEWVWRSQVVPLRRLCCGKIKTVRCWQEEEMHGQLSNILRRLPDFSEDIHLPDYYEVFRQACWAQGIGTRDQSASNPDVDFIKLMTATYNDARCWLAHIYATCAGSSLWEKYFGDLWDELVKPKLKLEEEIDTQDIQD